MNTIKHFYSRSFFIIPALLIFFIASCKKDNNNNIQKITPTTATPTKIGFYEIDSSIYKLLLTGISTVGTQSVNYDLIFDTGSGGLVIDANGIIPASMIGANGFVFTGDSTVVNGITITNQTNTVSYGDDNATTDKVYGNLAYASVTIGDENGKITVKRLPFFLYYKAVDGKNKKFSPHEFDVLGVAPEYDISFSNGAYITSPFSYFNPGTGLTKGFKIAALGTSNFSSEGTYVPAVTLGLTSDDLNSSGFVMHTLNFTPNEGYVPVFPTTITYSGKTISGNVLFDTGTEPYNYLEDKTYTDSVAKLLPVNTSVSFALNSGFNYSFTTSATDYLTYIENPKYSGADVSILSLEFFLNNEYLIDFDNHKLGVKNN
ncbi:MAG: hypothetical protein ACTHJ8_05005 [Mucilaginibacter sp.]|jgi:hypothetical protein